ncbi:MAG: S8 family serine peptidase [Actinobacteria bacterium]|nr:S8 family serine peptidase [Actinomycetota bacterium]
MRRLAPLACLAFLLASAGTASSALDPDPRSVIERAQSRLHRAQPVVPAVTSGDTGSRARVIVTLDDPPLAAAAPRNAFATVGSRRKLNLASSFSRSYLARMDVAQDRAITSLRAALPEARISRRYRVLLNGFVVSVPYAKLPELLNLGLADTVYPSYTYTSLLNRGPAVLGAPQFSGLTGAKGDGVKVAVVDDGVDNEHPFLSPAGLSFPPGFPKGPGGGTTPKVIVAKGFAGPGVGGGSIDREQSFHGTFVAGVIAGVEGTDVEASRPGFCNEDVGACHPAVANVSGVAPRAHIGNYRVFNVPLPLGGCCSGSTPEIVAAFEAAVRDGMDVINFSGGGPQADPRTDALIETVANVVRAGVVPIVSAGNDRDFFGLGTTGSPATAPDAIAVGATTNSHVFDASFSVVSPSVSFGRIPFVPTDDIPQTWIQTNQRLVDVGSIAGASRLLCEGALPAGSLRGAIALVARGGCQYQAKINRARDAGAIGMVVSESAPGDPGFAIFQGAGGTISDLDGARLRAAAAGAGGAVTIRFTKDRLEVPTTWPGVPTSFTAGGLTPFGHALKPDVTAPGANILSSTLPEFGGDPFIISAGTSFSAPHVSGVAALLLQRHPTWTPKQVKSAMMSTAGRAFADTALTQEASVLLQGAGLVNVGAADRPILFTDPQSLSFGYLDVNAGAASRAIPVLVSDAGDGAGAWSVEIQSQVSSSGASVSAAPFALSSGGTAVVQIVASAAAGAPQGDNFGFVLLRRGDVVRRIPYAFSVTRPQLTGSRTIPLKVSQTGNTATGGEDRARVYRWPTLPFGILAIFGVDPSVNDDGKETVYTLDIAKQAVNAGVVVERPALRLDASITALLSSNAPIHPWFLSSLDENDVQGYSGIPVNSNGLMPDFLRNVGAAGGVFLPPGRYYVSVDSGRDFFTGRSLAGPYRLRSWINDVKPPNIELITRRISAGRPTIVARVRDAGSGVDPLSMLLLFGQDFQLSATAYDADTGTAIFPIPREANPLGAGPEFMRIFASDFQETKNISTEGVNPMPNSRFRGVRMEVVTRPTVTWILPSKGVCLPTRARLQVAAGSNATISSVGFFDGRRQIGRTRRNVAGIYEIGWRTSGKKRGTHKLTAVVSDTRGREAEAVQTVRVCR